MALLENLQGISFQLSELAAEVAAYRQNLEFNPVRLNEVEERLELINTLKRKYGGSIAAVLATKERAETQLEVITRSEERIGSWKRFGNACYGRLVVWVRICRRDGRRSPSNCPRPWRTS